MGLQFNDTRETVGERTETTNFEGGEAYEPDSPELALTKVVINNLLEDTFYESAEEQLQSVEREFDACAEENPEFVLKLAKYARQEENLRQIPQILLVLSANDERTQPYVRAYGEDIMSRTDEPLEALAYHVEAFSKTVPNCLRKAIEDAMHQWNEWQYAKWDTGSREWQYRDLLNLVHPKPRDDERGDIFEKIAYGDLDDYDVESLKQEDTWESNRSSETTTFEFDLENKDQTLGEEFTQGPVTLRIEGDATPHVDVAGDGEKVSYEWDGDEGVARVEAKLTKEQEYRASLDNMGLFPRIRQARDMLQSGISADEIYGDVDDEWIRNSRLYPFRFYQAYKAIDEAVGAQDTAMFQSRYGFRNDSVEESDIPEKEARRAKDFLEHAMEVSTDNLPDILDDTFVAVDTSGSMSHPISGDSDLFMVEISTLFGALLYQRGADVGAFASDIQEYHGDRRDSVMTAVKDLMEMPIGGGTNGYLVPKALQEYDRGDYNQVIVFTDMQMWDDSPRYSGGGSSFRDQWNAYKQNVNPDASLYLVDLNSYGDLVTPEGAHDVYNISGWTENIIDFIDKMENVDGMVRAIEDVEPAR